MEAIRQYKTSKDGNLLLKIPKKYINKSLEIIILPAESKKNQRKGELIEMFSIMDTISDSAVKNGLTPDILEEILNEK